MLPKIILPDGKCLSDAATIHFVENTGLALEFTLVNQLEHNILVYLSYAGPKYRRVEFYVVNSVLSVTVETFSGRRH